MRCPGPEHPDVVVNFTPQSNASIEKGYQMPINPKKKAILDRIKNLEEAISKGREYLDSGAHADWSGFRPLFNTKMRDGKALPPHKDWVKNVFLSSYERVLRQAERLLERMI
jgi:hypothetical protein